MSSPCTSARDWRPQGTGREGDTLVVWKLDRLGRSLRHIVNVVHDHEPGHWPEPAGKCKLVFGIFASLG
jgi:hypothetical protein